jgi:hypothetical protein
MISSLLSFHSHIVYNTTYMYVDRIWLKPETIFISSSWSRIEIGRRRRWLEHYFNLPLFGLFLSPSFNCWSLNDLMRWNLKHFISFPFSLPACRSSFGLFMDKCNKKTWFVINWSHLIDRERISSQIYWSDWFNFLTSLWLSLLLMYSKLVIGVEGEEEVFELF